MKTLPQHKRKNGYDYTLVLRGKRSCIYKQHISSSVTRFEVFLIRVRPARKIKETEVPEHEVFPANEDFGKTAWCCWDLDAATKRFNNIEKL